MKIYFLAKYRWMPLIYEKKCQSEKRIHLTSKYESYELLNGTLYRYLRLL